MNYGKTTEKYQVSYQQIYSSVQKYHTKGIDGLIDKLRKRKRKSEDEMSELEKLRSENKILQVEKRKAGMYILYDTYLIQVLFERCCIMMPPITF